MAEVQCPYLGSLLLTQKTTETAITDGLRKFTSGYGGYKLHVFVRTPKRCVRTTALLPVEL
jgi:hypothetical protein